MGRPSDFTAEKANTICERLIDGQSLRTVCLAEDMPNAATVCRWLAGNEEFRKQYAHAREAQADTLADEILDISDDGTNDWMADKEEEDGFKYNGDAVQRSKLRIDARKWLAAKMQPKKYGDKVTQEISGPDGGPVQVQRVERVIVRPNAPDTDR